MFKKIIIIFLLLTVSILYFSCSFTKQIRPESPADWKRKRGNVGGVVTVSGERIEFSEENPGKIFNNCIIGDAKKKLRLSEATLIRLNVTMQGKLLQLRRKTATYIRLKIPFLQQSIKEEL